MIFLILLIVAYGKGGVAQRDIHLFALRQYANPPDLLLTNAFKADRQKDVVADTAHHKVHPEFAAFDAK